MSSLFSGVSITYTVANGSFSTSDLKVIAPKFFSTRIYSWLFDIADDVWCIVITYFVARENFFGVDLIEVCDDVVD